LKFILPTAFFLFGALGNASATNPMAPRSEGPCSGYAKSAAIRAYKAETKTVQGSRGIEYIARLVDTKPESLTYLVTIADNNEDGDTWQFDYLVDVTPIEASVPLKCKVLKTKKIAVRN
jgi:hypothetical protein